jgi:hypothetical protein
MLSSLTTVQAQGFTGPQIDAMSIGQLMALFGG